MPRASPKVVLLPVERRSLVNAFGCLVVAKSSDSSKHRFHTGAGPIFRNKTVNVAKSNRRWLKNLVLVQWNNACQQPLAFADFLRLSLIWKWLEVIEQNYVDSF